MTADPSPTAQQFDVFVSRASRDGSSAKGVMRALEEGGQRVRIADDRARSGSLLPEPAQAAIRGSRAMVLVWSGAAAESRWVMAELVAAFHLNRFIIPY